jgi:hypothetical protein
VQEVSDFGQWRGLCLRLAEEIGAGLGSEEDWPALLFIPGELVTIEFANDAEKAVAYRVIVPAKIRQRQARYGALINTSWLRRYESGSDPERAERTEIVSLFLAGPATEQALWAEIRRREQSCPALGAWQDFPADQPAVGLLPEALRGAIRASIAAAN